MILFESDETIEYLLCYFCLLTTTNRENELYFLSFLPFLYTIQMRIDDSSERVVHVQENYER